jgi:signal transduction histidine kinase/HAMP domain-containing protein
MAAIPLTSWTWWSHWRQSILLKVGTLFILLSISVCTYLIAASNLSGQLTGVSKAIEQAGTERMRIYKIASLLKGFRTSDQERAAIREEMSHFERVMEGLRFGSPHHRSIGTFNSHIATQLDALQSRWSARLKTDLEKVLAGANISTAVDDYLQQADDYVAQWDDLIQLVEQETAARLYTLRSRQIWFLIIFLALIGVTVVFLNRFVREPLRQLTAGAERLAGGAFDTEIRLRSDDDLGQLAKTFQRMAETIRHHIGELNSLHATGQEIAMLGPGGLEDVLRRIADRAAESLEADLAIVMVRHPTMECWIVEAASGHTFEIIIDQILLLEETPFSNEALETKLPVVVSDLAAYTDGPVRFRDDFHAKSFVGIPLMGPHGCLGVLVLLSIVRPRIFTEWDVRMAQQFASHAAVAMENARLLDALESESQSLQKQLRTMERNIAELTHEVKAPAGRVAEFASWIERDYGQLLDAKGHRYLTWIKNEGKDLATLAERTLDLARINHQPDPVESVDVGSVISEILALLKQDGHNSGIRVTIAADMPKLLCRRIHVKQIFVNLIGNAMKYMGRQRHPQVEIGWLKKEDGVQIFVRDNGVGIDSSMFDQIFLPFVRLGTEGVAGSGIGLSIVKTVAEQYKGSVNVESSPGAGSTFYVRLPALSEPSDVSANISMDSGVEAQQGQTGDRPCTFVGSKERSP